MPNWVYNVLGAHDEHGIKFIFDNCINDDKAFTFNKLIPMPQIFVKGCYPTTICSNFDKFKERYGKHIDFTFEKEGMLSCGYETVMTPECARNLMKKYGTDNWYDWAIRNWGCKWDATMSDSIEDGDYEFRFETPWSIPEEFIKTFALKAYKNVQIQVSRGGGKRSKVFGQEFFIELGEITVKKIGRCPLSMNITLLHILFLEKNVISN